MQFIEINSDAIHSRYAANITSFDHPVATTVRADRLDAFSHNAYIYIHTSLISR